MTKNSSSYLICILNNYDSRCLYTILILWNFLQLYCVSNLLVRWNIVVIVCKSYFEIWTTVVEHVNMKFNCYISCKIVLFLKLLTHIVISDCSAVHLIVSILIFRQLLIKLNLAGNLPWRKGQIVCAERFWGENYLDQWCCSFDGIIS